jgi:hypothetical protein
MKSSRVREKLQVIDGGLRRETKYGSLRIVAAPSSSRPFGIDALVVEEDTWLIMSAEPQIAAPEEHPIRLMTDVINAEKEAVGTVRVRTGDPLRFLAIVHDVDCEPTWREEWIRSALTHVFSEAARRRLAAVGLPLLGTRHGRLTVARFAELLASVLPAVDAPSLSRLWLIAATDQNAGLVDHLQSLLKAP